MPETTKKYDLEERVEKFGESVIDLCKSVKITIISEPIIKQLIKSATSMGANYSEANGASSRRDFSNKISICKKESQETRHWLRMFVRYYQDNKLQVKPLQEECRQLIMIFATIQKKSSLKIENK
ncbi:MAG: four helix bundle protein [bacterium]